MVVYILPSNAKTLLGLFCSSNCIHFCSHITLSSSSNVNIVEWIGPTVCLLRPRNFFAPLEKCFGHSLKILDTDQKICAPRGKLFAPPGMVTGLCLLCDCSLALLSPFPLGQLCKGYTFPRNASNVLFQTVQGIRLGFRFMDQVSGLGFRFNFQVQVLGLGLNFGFRFWVQVLG